MPLAPQPWSIKNVSANPGLFIPVLYAILQEFEREHEVASKMGTKTATKLFALTPRPNFQWRFITINEKVLRALTGIRSEHPFEEIFDLTKFRFFVDNDAMFTNQISTDGYAVHFQLARAAKKASIDLKLKDVSMSEIEEYFSVCSIDPGRKHVFTASYGYGEDEHEIRVPCQPISAVRSTLLEENRPHKEKKWQRVKGVSTARDKMPLIVFGRRMLKRREARGEAVIVTIDEYHTSQVCHSCLARCLRNVTTEDNISHHGIIDCQNCGMLWNRDVNASMNMYYIASRVWQGLGRPEPFVRPTSNQPTTANVGPERV
ncbi:hypothetical protein VTP01DRAFT_10274 [Rhizomucor pusillus]|uniref:uncharacterized protein n=1 Tax=Rhizomucor pusillus TaxID=4840 RepID=UPI003743B89B